MNLKKTKDDVRRNSLIEVAILSQIDSNLEQSDADDVKTKIMSQDAINASNARKRKKKISKYIEFINFKCSRMTKLERYKNIEYL